MFIQLLNKLINFFHYDRRKEQKDSTESEVIDELENAIHLPSQAEIQACAIKGHTINYGCNPLLTALVHDLP